MSFDYDGWLEGQIAAYCDVPDPKERYADNLYRVFFFDEEANKWCDDYEDLTKQEIMKWHEDFLEYGEKQKIMVYRIIQEYYSHYEPDEDGHGYEVIDDIVDEHEDYEPVYEDIW